MKRLAILVFVGAGCATPPATPQPDELPFATAYLDRGATAVPAEAAVDRPHPLPPKPRAADEMRGILAVRAELQDVAAEDDALADFLRKPASRTDLEGLAFLRSPAIRAARERYEAARTDYRQAADLKDLVALYRAFLRDTKTRVGPQGRPPATLYPHVDALSGELVARNIAIAFEKLRATIRDIVADAERAHADAARLADARGILAADVALHDSLVKVLHARLEAGKTTQAALLAFRSRLASLRVELEILEQQESAVRARWNRLLSRPESAAINLAVSSSDPAPGVSEEESLATALVEQQTLRIAKLSAERAAVGVRLAETMTLPRMDLGNRMKHPRSDFGVREAQVTEMRVRLRAAARTRDAARDKTQADTRQALFMLDAARRRWNVHSTDVVPLAARSFESTRGAYEGNRTGYIELLDSARRLLRARLGLIDTRRDFAHARARLLQAVGVRTENTK